jgi:hypothetical protein
MKYYENDIIVNNLIEQINGIQESILANHSVCELNDPKTYSRIITTIHKDQEPLYEALKMHILTHPAPICVNLPDEADDVSEESKEKAKEILNNNKKYFEQILKFKSTPKKTDFFDALMLSPNYNQTIKDALKDILDKIEKEA